MSGKTTIFVTGTTGYIGGSVLWRLLSHPDAKSFSIKVLTRAQSKIDLFKKFGVEAVQGDHSELDNLKKLASEADFVFAIADCDDLPAAEAILEGMKKFDATGKAPILIHTSGTGVLADNAAGMHATDTVYSDANVTQIESLPSTQIHRPVDLAVVAADQAGYVKTHIILPSTIYGLAANPLVDAGIQNPHSIQIPALIKASLGRGRGGMVGEGKNIWPNVHIDDVADLYIVLFDKIRADPDTPHGREGFYFGANGEHTLYDVGAAIGKALVEVGKATDPTPSPFTQAELDKYFGGSAYLGSNSRCSADRSKAIGWSPKKTTEDMIASINPEVKALVAKQG